MDKKKFWRNTPLYLLTAANVIYAVQNGFSWLTWVSIGLSLVVFLWDIVEVVRHRNKRN